MWPANGTSKRKADDIFDNIFDHGYIMKYNDP